MSTGRLAAAGWAVITRHRVFATAVAAGLALRVMTMLAFPPAIWFGGDSASYLSTALRHAPGTSRVSGYGIMLAALRPFHSFAVVTAVQHAMGLAIAVMIYAVLRRHHLPGWGATLAALPVLLSGYQIQLEQEILPSATFGFGVILAITLLTGSRDERPRWAAPAAAGALAVSATFWPVGLPLLILCLLYLAVRRAGWRTLAAAAAVAALPLAAYLLWFHHTYQRFAFSESDGVYLWSRTMTFANCAVIDPPAAERVLCPSQPVGHRPAASTFIWEPGSPLGRLPGKKFSPVKNALTMDFAERAIAAQPWAYLGSVIHDASLSFAWNIPAHPSAAMARRYLFADATTPWISPGYLVAGTHTVAGDQRAYGGVAGTRAVAPFASWLVSYQRYVYLRGTLLALVLGVGLGGIARRWRGGGWRRLGGWGGPGLLPWVSAIALLVVPVMTADYSLRYTLIAIPAACLAAGLAFAREAAPGPAAEATAQTAADHLPPDHAPSAATPPPSATR